MRKSTQFLLFILISFFGVACTKTTRLVQTTVPSASEEQDLYLEERESEQALAWVKPRSEKTQKHFKASSHFASLKKEIESIRLATDRLAAPDLKGEYVYNFWTDKTYPKGVWRRSKGEDYAKGSPQWENLIDVAALAKKDGKDWVWKGTQCLHPAYRYCLVHLSNGGEDAVVVREYDTEKKEFRKDGFTLPKGKHTLAWWSEDELLLATDFGPGSLTQSEYPRVLKRWKRGTVYTDSLPLFEGKVEDVAVAAFSSIGKKQTFALVWRSPSFFENVYSLWDGKDLKELPLPVDSEVSNTTETQLLVRLRSAWKLGAKDIPAGSLISLPASFTSLSEWESQVAILYSPDSRSTLESVSTTENYVVIGAITEVKGHLLIGKFANGAWEITPAELPKDGVVEVLSAASDRDELYVQYQSFVKSPTYYRGQIQNGKFAWTEVSKLPDRFDASGVVSEQKYATSKDGTKVPYFVVRSKSAKMDGSNPTLLYGYGGFEVSLLPRYSGEVGKVWIEKGGIYVIANIRGGGEFGAPWHQAALKENRQRAYDDFIAVAEDLVRLGYTSPRRLAIRGGSNGGLLVGAVSMQRPDLFHAVICAVPLLDMVRYQKMPPGDSWSSEYGSATDSVVGPAILKYSPYQNIYADKKYPKIYFWSSLKDDRVNPGHARKMVAKMEEQGHDVWYYESLAGGHGGGDIELTVIDEAMAYSYLFEQIVD